MRRILRISALVALVSGSPAGGQEMELPRLVAPGAGSELAVVESRCPTFHWSGVSRSQRYELVVYRAEDEAPEPRELYRIPLPADVRSWTPSADRCLDAPGRYAWSVGAVGGDEAESWSEAGVFEVAARPTVAEVEEAMAVLRRYVEATEDGGAEGQVRESSPRRGTPESSFAGVTPLGEPWRPVAARTPLDLAAGTATPQTQSMTASSSPSLVIDGEVHLGWQSSIYKEVFNQGLESLLVSNCCSLGVGTAALGDPRPGGNMAVGNLALTSLDRDLDPLDSSAGYGNTAVGVSAMSRLTTGERNIAVGLEAGTDFRGDEYGNIIIGNDGELGDSSTIRIGDREDHQWAFLAGKLALGFTDAGDEAMPAAERVKPEAQLVVRSSRDGTANNEDANVVWFENTDSDGGGADVLALKINEVSAENDNNFITFLNKNNNSLGAIEGDGAGGVTTASSGADYAEFLERLDGEAPMAAGDVVGLFGRRISHATTGADRVMVISTAPIVLGNDPGREHREGWEKVALLGQTPVRVVGPVRAGDLLVASGRGDGTAAARRPAALTVDELPGGVGRALESSEEPGEKKVLALVGVPDPALLGQMMKTWERALLARLGAAAKD